MSKKVAMSSTAYIDSILMSLDVFILLVELLNQVNETGFKARLGSDINISLIEFC